MTYRRGIVTAGTWCVDLNKTIARWPVEDTVTHYLSVDRQGGGSASNMAIDLKRLDPAFPVATMGVIGDDDAGRFLRGECERFEIEHSRLVLRDGAVTPFSDCFNARESGKRTHMFFPGVGDALTPDDFDFSGVAARILHLGLPGAHTRMDGPWGDETSGWAAVLKKARAAGLQTNLEMMSTTREKLCAWGRSAAPHLDYLIVNDFEIGAIADVETREGGATVTAKVEQALRKALDLGPMRLVICHFPEAALAVARDGSRFALGSVAMPHEHIVGVNGAGDAFAAGALYGAHEGFGVYESLRLGHSCAAASMREAPTTTGVVAVAQCLALADRYGLRPTPG